MLTDMPLTTAGGGFPWGLLILGGIIYFLWHKGVIGGPGRFGGPRHGGYGGYGNDYPPAPMPPASGQGQGPGQGPAGPGFRGPREYFDEWHRQAHAVEHSPTPSATPAQPPVAPTAPSTPPAPGAPPEPYAPGSDAPIR